MRNYKSLLTLVVLLAVLTVAILSLGSCDVVNSLFGKDHVCEFTETVEETYLKSAATCTAKAVYYKSCSCGEVSDETFESGEPLGHAYAENANEETLKSAATCTSAAVYYESCSVCGEKGTGTFTTGKPLDHTYVEKAIDSALKSEATCTSPAVYYKSCSVCGENSSECFEVGVTVAHAIVHHPAKDATNDEDGNVEYWSCSECDTYFSDADGKNAIEDKTSVFIPAINHTHTFDQKNTDSKYLVSEATCTSAAVYNYSCICGECGSDTFESGDPSEHSYVENAIDKYLVTPASCLQLAVYNKSCSACGAKGTETFVAGELSAHVATHHAATLPTCTDDGNKEYWTCDECGKFFADESCTTPVKYTDLIISGGHNLVEIASDDHIKSAATCQSPAVYFKYCSDCGEQTSDTFTYGELGEHNIIETVVDATCTSEGFVSLTCAYNCGYSEKKDIVPALGHSYVEDIVEPTCGATGLKSVSCSACDYKNSEILPALGHSYTETVVAPDCENGGYTVHTCSECGESYNSDVTDALGHEYEATETKDATCTEAGYVKYVCANGGCEKTETLDALGHSVVDATCTETSYCSVCKETLSDALGHAWEIINTVPATCTADGYIVKYCDVCDTSETVYPEDMLKKGHNNDIEWTQENVLVNPETCEYQTVETGVCPDCGETLTNEGEIKVIHKHVFTITTQATCMKDGVKTYTCTDCGDSYEESYSAPEAHNYDESGNCECGLTQTVVGGNSTTASGDALKGEIKFDDASLTLDSATQSQLGDSNVDLSVGTVDQGEVDKMAESLTDEEKALLEGKPVYNFEMSVDGESVTAFNGKVTVKIPYVLADGEDPDDIVVWYLAPVTNDEGTVVHVPTLVEAKYIEIGDQGYAVFETEHFSYYTVTKLTAAQRCEKFGHNILTTNVIATCLTDGYTLDYCMRCGNKEYHDFVPALGHDFVVKEDTRVELSCTTDGYEHHWCNRCQVGFDVIEPTSGHNWISESSTEATCTTAGYEIFKCSVCNEVRSVTTPVLPHNYEYTLTKATCTTAGYNTGVCVDCEHTVITDYVSPYGHNDKVITHAPTCLEQGYDEHYCDRCDTVFKKDNYKDKVDHDWNVDEPDCENDKFCKHCQKLDKPSHGHKFIDGKCEHCKSDCDHKNTKYSHDQKATCDQVGYKLYLCKDCNKFIAVEEIPSPPHDYRFVREVEATCISPAYTVTKCQNCKHEHFEPHGEPTEHKYSGGVCTYCGKENNNFYMTLVESLLNTNGFSVKLENVTFVYEERNTKNSPWIVEGYIKSIDIAELMLSVDRENGITGAAYCTFTIFDGPRDGETLISAKAIIENGYVYLDTDSDYSEANISVRYSVDAFIDQMLPGFKLDAFWASLDYLEEEVLPVIELMADANAADIENILSTVVDMLFSYENVNGNYEYVLDFAKIEQLNENLRTLPVSELVDLYFGEGTFDNIYLTALEILNLKLNEIPGYASKLGVDEETLIATADSVCKNLFGAPADFNLKEALERDDSKEVTVGMLITNGEYDETMIHELANTLRESAFYAFAFGNDETNAYNYITSVIDSVESGISFGFTTDKNGNALSCDVSATDFVFTQRENSQYTIGFDLSLIFGGSFDVDFDDIIPEIDSLEDAIPELDDEESYDKSNWGYNSGEMEYNGEWVYYEANIYNIVKYVNNYSEFCGYNVMPHCSGWLEYNVVYGSERYEMRVELRMLKVESTGSVVYLLADDYGNVIELKLGDNNTVYFVRPDGSTGSFTLGYSTDGGYDDKPGYGENGGNVISPNLPFDKEDGDNGFVVMPSFGIESISASQIALCFGDFAHWNKGYSSSRGESFYYNPATGEYTGESQHNHVVTESKKPVSCGEGGYDLYTCEYCGDSFYYYYNTFNHNYVLDEELSNIRTECETHSDLVYVCLDCGESYTTGRWNDHDMQHIYTLHKGATSCDDGLDCTYGCTKCGYVEWFNENWSYGHQYINDYTYVDGIIYSCRSCSVCGEAQESNKYCEVDVQDAEIDVDKNNKDELCLIIIPSVSGKYEIFTSSIGGNIWYNTWAGLYDENGMHIFNAYDGALNGHFGMICELAAGKTYTLRVANAYNAKVNVKPHDSANDVVLSHSDFGCDCGRELVIYTAFNGCMYVEEQYYDKCYLDIKKNQETYYDGCEEFMVMRVMVYNNNSGESFEAYTSAPIPTGANQHRTNHEWFDERGELYDDDGNYIGWWNKDGYSYVCQNCGKVTGKSESIRYYNNNGNEIKYEHLNYSVSGDGEFYVYNSEIREYVVVVDSYGNSYTKVKFEINESYDEFGNVTNFDRRYYEYDGCKVTETHENSSGKEDGVNVYFNHNTSEKEIPDESYYIGNGDGTTTHVTAVERYCTVCAASLSKYIRENTYDENGNTIKWVNSEYESYALSEDVYGYRLASVCTTTYFNFEYRDGRYVQRILSERYDHYDENGEIYDWSLVEYQYNYGNWCDYDVVRSSMNGEEETEFNHNQHNMCMDLKLHDGSLTCEDGVDFWYKCIYCDYEYLNSEYWSYDHDFGWDVNVDTADEIYDLSEYGAQCGGYIYVHKCACGERLSVSSRPDCELEYSHDYVYDNDGKLEYQIYTYACSVTHTEEGYNPCGFVYTYEYWYTVDEDCRETAHQRFTYGLHSDNPLVIEWSYVTGGYRHNTEHHSIDTIFYVEDGYEVYENGYYYTCRKCGIKTQENKTYSYIADSVLVKTVDVTKYFSNDTGKLYQVSTNVHSRYENEFTGDTHEKYTYEKNEYYNELGELTNASEYIHEYIWVYNETGTYSRLVMSMSERREYHNLESLESGIPNYFDKCEYYYDECICQPTVKRTWCDNYKDNGEIYEETYTEWLDHLSWHDSYWVEEPTCTQSGIIAQECAWCDETKQWSSGYYGHSYYYNDQTGTYFCSRCKLENFTGYDGSIVIEDLTWKLGEGVNYVLGYYDREGIPFEIYISLIVVTGSVQEDGYEEYLLNDLIAMKNTGNTISVNLADLAAAIKNMASMFGEDWSICADDCMVRISFVPEYNNYDCDYAITLDPHALSYTSESLEYKEGITASHSALCTLCGEQIEDEACDFVVGYRNTVIENDIIYVTTAYTCRHCSNEYTTVEWTELTDASICEYTAFLKVILPDEEFTLEQNVFVEHDYDYTFSSDSVSADDGIFNPMHSMTCTRCGDKQDEVNCHIWSVYSFNYVENGVSKYAEYCICHDCGFAYKIINYSVLTDSSCCEYTRIWEIYWGFDNGYYINSFEEGSSIYYQHNYTYTYDGAGNEGYIIPSNHRYDCVDCGATGYEECSFSGTDKNEIIDGIYHNRSTFICYHCGFEYIADHYKVYEEGTCNYVQYYEYSWYDSNGELVVHKEEHPYVNCHDAVYKYIVQEDGGILRTNDCNCGEYNYSEYNPIVYMNSPEGYSIKLVENHNSRYFIFEVTVDVSSRYSFYSSGNVDTWGYIYDSEGNQINSSDNSWDEYGNWDYNFRIDLRLEAGETYYLVANGACDSENCGYNLYFDHYSVTDKY